MLWHTTGVTETRGGLRLRASPSSGALFSTELYVAGARAARLAPGLWHYDPAVACAGAARAAAADALLLGAIDDEALRDGRRSSSPPRSSGAAGHKYRDRTYRYVLADLGHALENLRVAAGALGVPARFVAAFDEARPRRRSAWTRREEGVLARDRRCGVPVAPARARAGVVAARGSSGVGALADRLAIGSRRRRQRSARGPA